MNELLRQTDLEFIEQMEPETMGSFREVFNTFMGPAYAEVKHDGYRFQLHHEEGNSDIFTGQGTYRPIQFPKIETGFEETVKGKGKYIFDGELVAWDFNKGEPRPYQLVGKRALSWNNIEEKVEEVPLKAEVFDVLFKNEDLRQKSYKERKQILRGSIDEKEDKHVDLVGEHKVKDVEEAKVFFKDIIDTEREGVVFKAPDSTYKAGKSKLWLKKKPKKNADLPILGYKKDETRKAGIGAAYLGIKERGELRFFSGVGIRSPLAAELRRRSQNHIEKTTPTSVWLEPSIGGNVGFQSLMRSSKKGHEYKHSTFTLRNPRLYQIKSTAEITTLGDLLDF